MLPSMRLIIDTDIALGAVHDGRPRDVDDAYAVVASMNNAAIDLLGITTVFGNAPLSDTDAIAREVVAMKGSGVPVATGAAGPISTGGPATNDAVEFMAETLKTRSAHIAAIGPLTNLGLLARRYPERLANAASVVIVGGRTVGNRFMLHGNGPVNDVNVENDIEAARALLEHGVPVTMAGFELTSQVALGGAHLEALPASPIREHFLARTRPWLTYWLRAFPGDTGFHPWDSAAIDWLLHPERYVREERGWRIGISPDDPDVRWLETSPDWDGGPVTFLTGFVDRGAAALVDDIVQGTY